MTRDEKHEELLRINCTSWHKDSFLATIAELKLVFGAPDTVGYIDDKVQFEWLLDLRVSNILEARNAVITIYDWKEFRKYDEDEYIRLHIGGHTSAITKIARIEIQKVLELFRDED